MMSVSYGLADNNKGRTVNLLKSSQICFCLDMTAGFGSLRPGRLRHSLCPRSSRTHKYSRLPLLLLILLLLKKKNKLNERVNLAWHL